MTNKTTIIAEAGVNHNGDIALAKELIHAASDAGADYVKFQTFQTQLVMTASAKKAEYQAKNTGDDDESQLDMIRKLELDYDTHYELIDYAKQHGIKFFSTGFDLPSVRFLKSLDLGLFKIPSGEITNLPLLRLIGSYGDPIILSTGMAKIGEIEDAISVLEQNGTNRENITVLHCTTEYPAPFDEVNLNAMKTIGDTFGVKVGYSDHTSGITIPIAAVALGATVIEKHFTMDRNLPGPDHKASLEPHELSAMVKAIREVEVSLGSGLKQPSPSEEKNIPIARKSIVAKTDIAVGELFNADNLDCKRPGDGISPMQIDVVIGKKAIRNFKKDEKIET